MHIITQLCDSSPDKVNKVRADILILSLSLVKSNHAFHFRVKEIKMSGNTLAPGVSNCVPLIPPVRSMVSWDENTEELLSCHGSRETRGCVEFQQLKL